MPGMIRAHKEQCYARRELRNESLKALLGGLERGLVGTLTTIGSITEERTLSDTEKVNRIRALLAQQETRRLLEKDPVAELKASLVSVLDEDGYYKILESKSVWIQNRVSPILKLDLNCLLLTAGSFEPEKPYDVPDMHRGLEGSYLQRGYHFGLRDTVC
jgi:hypothetical protein